MQDDTESRWLIISDIARQVGRPDSTVRNWRRVYRNLLPSRRNARGQVVYPLSAFERIRDMAEQRYTPREIQAELTREQAEPAQPRAATLDDVVERLDRVIELLERIAPTEPVEE